jgi:hypothetical protein
LAATADLSSAVERRGGSSPSMRTIFKNKTMNIMTTTNEISEVATEVVAATTHFGDTALGHGIGSMLILFGFAAIVWACNRN